MRQHPIPQNILDIEFKLFTKFTVREFAYMAIGVGFGGIFLYLFSRATIPAIVAFPIFLVSSGIGLFLGLVPINDQNADVFLRNYVLAITKPTQRVWKGEQFDEKIQLIAQQKGVTLGTTGTMDRSANTPSNSKVIGGTARNLPTDQFIEEETLSEIEKEEVEKLEQIEHLAKQQFTMSADQGPQPIQTNSADTVSKKETPSEMKVDQKEIVEDSVSPHVDEIIQEVTEQKNDGRVLQSDSSTEVDGPPKLPEISQNRLDMVKPIDDLPKIERIDSNSTARPNNTQTVLPNVTTITSETATPIATLVEDYPNDPGNIAMYLTNDEGTPITHAMVLIKDGTGSIVQAIQSDPQGLVLPNKKFQKGTYQAEIRHDNVRFPRVNFILDGKDLPVVNITSIK